MTTTRIARITDLESKNIYNSFMRNLQQVGLVEPGQDHYLTKKGKQVVAESFDGEIEVDLEFLIGVVKNFKQVGVGASEVDAFILDAADTVYITLSKDYQDRICDREKSNGVPLRGTYLLAGIEVLNKAVNVGLLARDSEISNGHPCIRYQG